MAFVRAAEAQHAQQAADAARVPQARYAWPELQADMDVLTGESMVILAPLPLPKPSSWPLVHMEGGDDKVW